MKRACIFALFVIVVAAGVMAPGTVFAEPMDFINLGLGGIVQTMPHCKATVYLAEYEHMLRDSKISVLGRVIGVDYKFDDGSLLEKGRPKGLDVGIRYYLAGGMKGLYIGGSVGYWKADWTFSDNRGTADEVEGKGNTKSIRANVDIGARLPISSSSVSIMPGVHVGKFFPSTSCEYTAPASRVGTSCNQDTEVGGYYFYLTLMAGIGF